MEKNKKQYVVLGMGRFGISVARTLYGLGHDVLGVDNDEEIVQSLSNELTHVVVQTSWMRKLSKLWDYAILMSR